MIITFGARRSVGESRSARPKEFVHRDEGPVLAAPCLGGLHQGATEDMPLWRQVTG